MNITEFYRNAAELKKAFDAGQVALEDLSDEGKTALAIARRQISVNDLSNEGREALGLEALPAGPGVGERLLHGAGDVIEATGLGEFGRRVGEQYAGATETVREAPGQILQSLMEAGRETGRGRLGEAATEVLGAVGHAGRLATAPFAPILSLGAVPGGMVTEEIGRAAGIPPEQPLTPEWLTGAATPEFTARGVGELLGSLLVPGMEMGARMPRPPRGPFGPVRGEPIPEGAALPRQGKGPFPMPSEAAERMAGEPWAAPPAGQSPLRQVSEIDPLYEELVAEAQRRAYTGPEARPTPEELARPTDPRVARRLEVIDSEVELRRREAKRAATPEERLAISGRLRVLRKERAESVKMLRPDIPAPGRAPRGSRPTAPVAPTPTSPYEQFFGEYQEQVPPAPESGQRTAYGPTPGFTQTGEFVPPVEELVGLEPTQRLSEAQRVGGEFYPGVRELREEELAQALDTTSPQAQAVAREVAQPVVVPTDAAILEHSQIAVENDLASAASDRIVAEAAKPPVAAVSPTAPNWFQRAWTGETREVPFEGPKPMPVEGAGGPTATQPPQTPPPPAQPVRMHRQTLERLTKMGFSEAEAQRVWGAAAAVPKGRRLLMKMAKEGVTADVMRERWLAQGRTSLPELYEGGGTKSAEGMLIADLKAAGHGVTVGESLTPFGETGKRIMRAAAKGAEVTDSMLEALAESKGYKVEWVTVAEGQKTFRAPELVGPAGRMRIHDRAEMARFLSVEGPGAAPVGYEGVVPPAYFADDLIAALGDDRIRVVSKFHPLMKRMNNYGPGVDVAHLANIGTVTAKAVMATDPAAHLFNQRGIELWTHTKRTIGRLRDKVDKFTDKYGLGGNKTESNNLFAAIDILNRGNMDEIAQLRQRVRPELLDAAIVEHRVLVNAAAELMESIRSDFRRVSGTYITHWPLEQELLNVEANFRRYSDLAKQFPDQAVYSAEAQRLGGLVEEVRRTNTDAKLKRATWLPEQGYFGPIDESRTWNLAYETSDYRGVMHKYLDGVERIFFTDRFLPEARTILKAESLKDKPLLVRLMHEHIGALMGGAGARSRVATYNLAMRITKNPMKAMSVAGDVDLGVNIYNNFMVMKAMGLKASNLIANALNPFMTGLAEVGSRAWLHGLKSAFTVDGWRLAEAVGTATPVGKPLRFTPYSRAEIAEGLSSSLRGGHITLKVLDAVTGKLAQKTMAAHTFIEKFNHVHMTNAGAWKGRNILGYHPVQAARYGAAVSRGTNWLYGMIDKPALFTGPAGRAVGLFKTWVVNYVEKMVDYGRMAVQDGNSAPLIRSVVALMLTAGTAGIPMYREAKQQIIKRTGKDILPEINPVEWLTWMAGLGSGWTIEGALSPFNLPQTPGGLADTIAPLSTLRELGTDPLKAVTPLAVSGAIEALKETAAGQALHPKTGKPIARRGAADVAATAFRLRQPAQALRARALSEIANAFQGGNAALVRRIVADARRQGLLIDQGTIAAIRRRVEVERRAPSAAAILGRGLD